MARTRTRKKTKPVARKPRPTTKADAPNPALEPLELLGWRLGDEII